MLAPQKESIFGCSCRLWLFSWRRARVFARSCSLLSKYLPISWKQRKEQSHAQCHVTHRIRIFDKISEHVKVAKSVDIAVPELAVTTSEIFFTLFSILVRVVEYNSIFSKVFLIEELATFVNYVELAFKCHISIRDSRLTVVQSSFGYLSLPKKLFLKDHLR